MRSNRQLVEPKVDESSSLLSSTLNNWRRIFSIRDFALLWSGAFVSFCGSWIQTVAQGYFVFQLTHDESALGLVAFCSSVPVFAFGLAAGSLVDRVDRRLLMVIAQLAFAAAACYLAIATWMHFVTYPQVVLVALIAGLVSTVEMPTRQSIVSRVVPPEELGTAVPIMGLTYNASRIFGPAIGTWLLNLVGVATCYFINGLSFFALVWTSLAIKSDLSAVPSKREPVKDLIFEGFRFTMADRRLRTVFLLEAFTGIFGVFFVMMMPAITGRMLGLEAYGHGQATFGLGLALTCSGLGAITALFLNTSLSHVPYRGLQIKVSMTALGFSLLALSFIRLAALAYPLFYLLGLATVMQFNTSNTVFQILSTERNRGRVIAMHIWALNGLSPFGMLFFGWLASASNHWPHTHFAKLGPFEMATNTGGPALALLFGGCCILGGSVAAWLSRGGLKDLSPELANAVTF